MSDKVLFVDDEPAVLDGYRRLLGRELQVETVVGGASGLDVIAEKGPFSVVVSDMRMPHMNGAEFLTRVRDLSPDTVRMALTGQTDMDTAIAAVNEGRIFRFMTKPVPKETLLKAIECGFAQFHLIVAEKELLEGTLKGCVSVLSEMLSFSNPAAFGRALRLQHFVQHVATKLQLRSSWSFEIAAMLSQLGCVTLSLDIVNAAYSGERLSEEDQRKYDGHTAIAAQMLSRIPRMDAVAQMIAFQGNATETAIKAASAEERREIDFGRQLLRAGLTFDALLNTGLSPNEAYLQVRTKLKGIDQTILDALSDLHPELPSQIRECNVTALAVGMVLFQDLYTNTGALVAAKGFVLSHAWIERLQNHAYRGVIPSKLKIQIPRQS